MNFIPLLNNIDFFKDFRLFNLFNIFMKILTKMTNDLGTMIEKLKKMHNAQSF